MHIDEILGDYKSFFADIRQRLEDNDIDISGRAISHIAFRTATFEEYLQVQGELKAWCSSNVENVWNGRPIDKLLLKKPLDLGEACQVSLIELIPPEHRQEYPMGLEHVGVVLGETFDDFTREQQNRFTGQQDQGPYCQPMYITFDNNRTVKFYRWALKEVVEKEGREFVPYQAT